MIEKRQYRYLALRDSFVHIGPTGEVTLFSQGISANSGPYAITEGPDGNLWFTEDGSTKIGVITTTGNVTELNVVANTPDPAAITLGPDNNIWFTDYSTDLIGQCAISA